MGKAQDREISVKPQRTGTVALAVRLDGRGPQLVDQFSDDREIDLLAEAIAQKEKNAIELVYALRKKQAQEDDEFGNYVEELLSQPFLRAEVRQHGLQWLNSKIRIEHYQRCESEATRVIAQFAFQIFCGDPKKTEFVLSGPAAEVNVKVFVVAPLQAQTSSAA